MLRALAGLAESPGAGAVLTQKMLADAGIAAMRGVPASETPALVPPSFALSAELSRGASADAGAAAALGPASAGFPFECARDFHTAFATGATTPVEVAERALAWTRESDALTPAMRVFIAQRADDVMAQAEASQHRWSRGEPIGPFDGVPIAVKDELDQAGYPTTVGTRFLGRDVATADATAVARLRAAGAVLLGKANMHEIGLGVTGLNPHHGAARNPYHPDRATGGSSSGPAAAVAMGLGPVALGADGGGSIRIPASLCGLVGLKPTYGRVSEHGAAPLCWSVAHIGPIGGCIADVAAAYALIAGPDPLDPHTQGQPAVHLEGLGSGDLKGLRIGVYAPWFEHAEQAVVASCQRALDALLARGAERVDVVVPELGLLRAVHLVTIVGEMAGAHMTAYDAHRKEYGADTRLNLALGRKLTAADYVHAQRHRVRLAGHFERILREVDVLVTPTTGRTAPVLASDAIGSGEANLEMTDQIMRFAPAANLTGLPALSVPCGYDGSGLPIGIQLLGRAFDEARLLQVGRALEESTPRMAPRVHRRLLVS
jgi:Asp-tRNA(Asn)/Glu-tRNA(Gln) amidotransferase A subunit family amidase